MEDPALLRIWTCIRDELARLQDEVSGEMAGHIMNPIARMPYAQNTGCAALVFATEYSQTGESAWLLRAQQAIAALNKQGIYRGVDEPKWYRLGWENHKGSLFATGTLLDAYWRALGLLGQQDGEQNVSSLLRYLSSCSIKPGLFAHDSVQSGSTPSAVQNTSAIALYLMEAAALRVGPHADPILEQRDVTLKFLFKGQRKDGFWPYVYPGTRQQLVYRFRGLRGLITYAHLRRYFIREGDQSIYFGDAVHHCLVLYYLAKSINLRRPVCPWYEGLTRGWIWVCEHLVETEDGAMRFDFEWEPVPYSFRWGNFRDTSTYFLILAALPLLARLGITTEDESYKTAKGILIHIESSLLDAQRFSTSILPYEGPDQIIRFVLPRVGEASAWKGALLSEFVLDL